jgi:hypothetical protein
MLVVPLSALRRWFSMTTQLLAPITDMLTRLPLRRKRSSWSTSALSAWTELAKSRNGLGRRIAFVSAGTLVGAALLFLFAPESSRARKLLSRFGKKAGGGVGEEAGKVVGKELGGHPIRSVELAEKTRDLFSSEP